MNTDGSVMLAGHTDGIWNAESTGEVDFAAVKLDAEGEVVWKWQVRHLVPVVWGTNA